MPKLRWSLVLMLATVVMFPFVNRTDVASATPVVSDTSVCVWLREGSPGDTAVINITNTGADASGYGSLRASNSNPPVFDRSPSDQYSSVNFATNTPANPNLALVTIGPDRKVCYDGAVSGHDTILDVSAVIPATGIRGQSPRRLIDTRSTQLVGPSSSVCVEVDGANPGDIAVVNITNTAATGTGFGSLRASNAAPVPLRPRSLQYSSVNFSRSTPVNPNLAFTTVGPDGQFCYDGAVASHHVILDLAATILSSNIDASEPRRILDTRTSRPIAPNSSICVEATGGTPRGTAVVNITNTGATGTGFGTVRASNATPVFDRPRSDQFSSVNFAANTPANPNLAFTTIGPDNRFCYDGVGAGSDVILDLAATFAPSSIRDVIPRRVLDTRSAYGSNIVVPTYCGRDLEGRPVSLGLNCSGSWSLESVQWTSWGLPTATGTGRLFARFSGCAPDCDNPDAGPVEIELRNLTRLQCGDFSPEFIYREARYRTQGSNEPFEVWNIAEEFGC